MGRGNGAALARPDLISKRRLLPRGLAPSSLQAAHWISTDQPACVVSTSFKLAGSGK